MRTNSLRPDQMQRLINLIIFHALSQKDIEKARPYYEALKERAPGSEFVGSVAEIFETKTPAGK